MATDIRANWKFVPRETEPRAFSKLKVVIALNRIGKWAALRDWLNETDYGDLFDAAQDFREDNVNFTAALSTAPLPLRECGIFRPVPTRRAEP